MNSVFLYLKRFFVFSKFSLESKNKFGFFSCKCTSFFKLLFQVRFKMELIPIKPINPNSHNHRHISNSRWILTYSSSNRQCNSKTDFISNLCEPVWSSLWKSLALKFSRFVRVQKLAATFSLFSKISNAIPFGHAHSSQHILAF